MTTTLRASLQVRIPTVPAIWTRLSVLGEYAVRNKWACAIALASLMIAIRSYLIASVLLRAADESAGAKLRPRGADADLVQQRVRAEELSAAHLFGVAPRPREELSPDVAPPTDSTLTLVGTIAMVGAGQGIAMIRDGGSAPVALYRVDEPLPQGAVLRSIYADSVLIERNGAIEKLVLPMGAPLVPQPARIAQRLARPFAVGVAPQEDPPEGVFPSPFNDLKDDDPGTSDSKN
ncbi:MAG TPA: type II secretion system protein N [Steroidobacteraceae bacterium]|nr:type II secretion system protein N [Steroidobacteraceae bacterium]